MIRTPLKSTRAPDFDNNILSFCNRPARLSDRPNRYEAGRAHVVVFNWTNAGAVSVDLSKVLRSGDAYEILNVQDLFGSPVVSGTYTGGSVSLPVRAVAAPTPVGGFVTRPGGTGTQFNTYLVRKRGS